MEQVSYKQRILSLIKLNKTDIEIKQIIREEYKKVFKLSDIEYLRSTDFVDSDIQKQDIEDKISFVLDLLNGNPNKSYTKKQIVDLVKIKHEIKLSKNEIKEILWSKLRTKIIYDSDNWTYKLKDEKKQLVDYNERTLQFEIMSSNDEININIKTKKILNELSKSIYSINLIFKTIKDSVINNNIQNVTLNFQALFFEIKKIENLIKKENLISNQNEKSIEIHNSIDLIAFFNILKEEKYRLGSPIVNQYVDNITKRIKDSI